MKTKIAHILFICLTACALTGCYQDKGNYDYTELGAFYIDVAGARTSFTVQLLDTLRITPNVVYYGDEANLEYLWKMYPKPPLSTAAMEISTERNLAVPIPGSPIAYFLEYVVTEKSTGRATGFRYDLWVQAGDPGMLVLYEREQGGVIHTDFGLITPNFIFFEREEEDRVVYDIFSTSNPDYPLSGSPVGIGGYAYSGTTGILRYITLVTSNDLVRLSEDDYTITHHFDDLFLFPPAEKNISYYWLPYGEGHEGSQSQLTTANVNTPSEEFLYINNMLYVNWGSTIQQTYFTETMASTLQKLDFAPIVGRGFSVHAFDRLSRRFVQISSTSNTFLANGPDIGEPFEGMDLVYIGRSQDWYSSNMIFKGEGADEQKRYFRTVNWIGSPSYTPSVSCLGDISDYPGIQEAKLFAMAYRSSPAYYVANNRIYQIKYDTGLGTVEPQPVVAWPGNGETITAIHFLRHPGRPALVETDVRNKYLFVGTWNGTEGKVYVFEVNRETDGSLIQTPVVVYSGFGKIKDFGFKF